jgi:hypothetical protein
MERLGVDAYGSNGGGLWSGGPNISNLPPGATVNSKWMAGAAHVTVAGILPRVCHGHRLCC